MSRRAYVADFQRLVEEIEEQHGEGRVEELKNKCKEPALERMTIEIICQVISLQAWYRRLFFLVLFPRYILPYLVRIREE